MKRPIVVMAIGYIIGIFWGLYCKCSIALLYLILFPIVFTKRKIFKSKKRKFKLISISRYSRYLKLLLKTNVIILIIFTSIISNTILIYLNKKYEKFYSETPENIELIATVVSNKEEKDYKYVYKVKINQINMDIKMQSNYETSKKFYNYTKDVYIYIYTEKSEKYKLDYGDKIYIKGNYEKPEVQRNYKGFDYSRYLKQKKIYGTVTVKELSVISKNSYNKILELANNCFLNIKKKIESNYSDETKNILLGISLGYTNNLDEEVKQDFKDSNISHILAISGMHINFIIICFLFIFNKIVGKRCSRIISSIFLILYMLITGFSPSIVRATVMGIFVIYSNICYRKNDIWTSIGFSILIILIYNPYLIENIGLQLSFLGTIGIILFNENVLLIIGKVKIIPQFIKELLSITISAQIAILPITIINFNTVGISFLITNVLVSLIIGPIVILSFSQIILFFIDDFLSSIIQKILEPLLQILVLIAKLGAKIPFSKIYVTTPNFLNIFIYYFLAIILNQILKIYIIKNKNNTQIRVKNLINLLKYKFNKNKKRVIVIFIILSLIVGIFKIIPQNLEIHFIDVGQGDSCLIRTPFGKNILIDGGGNLHDKYYVGEKTLLPYLLDRDVSRLDYIIISHFDVDHVRRNFVFITGDKSKKYNYWQTI